MTQTEIILAWAASSPVVAGVGAAVYKLVQDWRKRREEREDRRLELEHDEEIKRIEAERQARVAEATADATGRHELEGYRGQARTLERLWARVEDIEAREERCQERVEALEERDDLRAAELEQCHRDRDELRARVALIESVPAVRKSLSPYRGTPAQTGDVEIEEKKK